MRRKHENVEHVLGMGDRDLIFRSMLARAAGLLALSSFALLSWSAASCGVDVPVDQTGFPCNSNEGCDHGLVCIDGFCVTDPCEDIDCADGTVCVDGECAEMCRIDGAIYAADDPNPENECLQCIPAVDTLDWTPAPSGTPCGEGLVCDGEGVCGDVPCEEDCPALDGWYDVGTEEYPCCDEDMSCTCLEQEHREHLCVEGECEYSVTDDRVLVEDCNTCDDGNLCTENPCVEGHCETHNLPEGSPCGSFGECDGEGLCSEGCVISEQFVPGGTVNPDNVCEICDPLVSETSWSPRDGIECEVDNECADGLCEDGVCTEVPICSGESGDCGCDTCVDCTLLDGWTNLGDPYPCCDDEGLLCSTCQDQEYREYGCFEMTCDFTSIDARTEMSDCSSCADENVCVVNFCEHGACESEPAPAGTPCGTAGECDGSGQCSEGCLVDGSFYPDGTINPDNECLVCSTAVSQSAWTNRAAGASCGNDQVCDGEGTCAPRCELPWGGDIGHGESVTAYENEIEACGDTCVD
ncbi:MAG: hypothetical protein ACOCVR_00570, partial [Myxococcota bacterium]